MQGPKLDEGEDEVVSDINITPLCDIFVVLLIIFMVTAEMIVQSGPAVDLPENAVASEQPSQVVVTITGDLRYFVGDAQVQVDPATLKGLEPLREVLAREIGKTKGRSVMVRADKRLSIRDVMRVVDVANRANAAQVAIGTRLNVAAPDGATAR